VTYFGRLETHWLARGVHVRLPIWGVVCGIDTRRRWSIFLWFRGARRSFCCWSLGLHSVSRMSSSVRGSVAVYSNVEASLLLARLARFLHGWAALPAWFGHVCMYSTLLYQRLPPRIQSTCTVNKGRRWRWYRRPWTLCSQPFCRLNHLDRSRLSLVASPALVCQHRRPAAQRHGDNLHKTGISSCFEPDASVIRRFSHTQASQKSHILLARLLISTLAKLAKQAFSLDQKPDFPFALLQKNAYPLWSLHSNLILLS
jgi:hypothetical protein